MEARSNRIPALPKAIARSWHREARSVNVRNFRFYPILLVGFVATIGSFAFVATVLTRLILGFSTGTADAPGILLMFGVMAVIFYWGIKTVMLRENNGPGLLGFASLILALVLTFLDNVGSYERYVFAPIFWVFAIISLSAGFWLAERESDNSKAVK